MKCKHVQREVVAASDPAFGPYYEQCLGCGAVTGRNLKERPAPPAKGKGEGKGKK